MPTQVGTSNRRLYDDGELRLPFETEVLGMTVIVDPNSHHRFAQFRVRSGDVGGEYFCGKKIAESKSRSI